MSTYIIWFEVISIMSMVNKIAESRPWEWVFSGIGVVILTLLFSYFKRKKIKIKTDEHTKSKEPSRRAPKITVIDDHANPIVKLLRDEGYDVDEDNGSLKNLRHLENGYYDLILLDFDGVGVEFSKKQGIGVLEHIKTKNPNQKILAYSNKNWGLDYQEFIQLADGVLGKNAGYWEYKRKIDELLGR